MKNNEICFTGPKITSRDRKFERSRVNLLSYIGEKIGTEISLREIENFERSKFELSRVTCSFPYCGPSQSPGTMIWTIFKLHYIEKLSYTFELLWFSCCWEEEFQMTPTNFRIEKELAIYLNNLDFRLPKDDLYQVWLKLAWWFWKKNHFSILAHVNIIYPIVIPPNHDFNRRESTLYKRVSM